MPKIMPFAVGGALVAWIAWGACAVQVTAQSDSDDVKRQLDELQRKVNALETDNQSLRGELDDVKAKTNQDWLTEARAEEIKGLVSDVLADADTRASLLQDGMSAGWSDHFFLADPNGRFKLIIDGQVQVRWVYNYLDRPEDLQGDVDQHRNGFENTRTRLTFRGYVFSPDIQYLVRGDFSRTPLALGGNATLPGGYQNLLDAWVRYDMDDNWSVQAGQFKLPFNREELVSSAEQLAVERSLVNEAFSIGRSQGVELTYASNSWRVNVAYSDGASGNNFLAALLGPPRTNSSALAVDTEWAVTSRVEFLYSGTWAQFSDFTSRPGDEFGMLLGIAGHTQESESSGAQAFSQTTTRFLGGTIDASFEFGGANLYGSFIYEYADSPQPAVGVLNMMGAVGQAGVYLAPKWEVFVRGEWAQIEGTSGSSIEVPDLGVLTTGVNYYLEGHDLKWTTDIGVAMTSIVPALGVQTWASDLAGYRPTNRTSDFQIVFRTQFQLLF